MNNSPWENVFPAGEANFWASYVSVPRKVTPGHPGWIWFVQCPGLICLAACWSGPATSAQVISAFLDYILQVCQSTAGFISLAGKASLVSISDAILLIFYDPSMFTVFTIGVRISWKKLCWKGSIVAEMPYCVSYLVYYDIVWRVDLRKLWRNFVWAWRTTTTTNCRVSSIWLLSSISLKF